MHGGVSPVDDGNGRSCMLHRCHTLSLVLQGIGALEPVTMAEPASSRRPRRNKPRLFQGWQHKNQQQSRTPRPVPPCCGSYQYSSTADVSFSSGAKADNARNVYDGCSGY